MVNLIPAAMLLASLGVSLNAQKPPAGGEQFDKLQKAMADGQAKAARPGDSALTCDAILNEIVSSMRDPAVSAAATKAGAWGAEQQRQLEEASGASRAAIAGQMAMGLASSLGSMFLPGLGMLTGRGQNAATAAQVEQNAAAARNVQQLEERMNEMMGILPQLMRGQRLLELGQGRKCDWLAGPPNAAPPSGAFLPPR